VTEIYAYGTDENTLIGVAASVERLSSHPLANAIVLMAEEIGIALSDASEFQSFTGVGVEGRVNGILCRVSKPDFEFREQMKQVDIREKSVYSDCLRLEQSGKTAVVVYFDQKAVGVIGISDPIRPDSAVAVNDLKRLGVRCLMLTGDNTQTAEIIARSANMDGFYAELMPQDK
jgi:P-type E1-E2 ATPase